jgi:surfactin synthase thioesterase subunit
VLPPGEPDNIVLDRIRAAWSSVLDLPAERIGPGDDFFALGGNSLSALRVTLETDGVVTLADLIRNPRLAELTALLQRRQRRRREALLLLSSSVAGGRCTLICVPYPGGHPINFRPLALAVEELTTDLVVYGLEAPGHNRADEDGFVDVADTARLAIGELLEKTDHPVLVWGHCGGAAVALELVRQLEERGHDVRGLLIGSKLLPPIGDMHESIEMVDGWNADEIVRFMVDETGYTELDGLDPEHTGFMAHVFRHDVCSGFRYLIDSSIRRDRPVAAPLSFVIAADDTALAAHRGGTGGWDLLAAQVRPEILDHGGHYFVQTNPDAVAELIVRTWEA